MDLIQTDVEKEQKILERMVQAEERQTGKMFTIAALERILRKVPREIAIGAIIKSELFKRNELAENLDNLLGNIFDTVLPHYLYDILKEAVPDFIVDLKILLTAFVFRWLYKLPGLDLPIELEPAIRVEEATPPPVPEQPPIGFDTWEQAYKRQNKVLKKYIEFHDAALDMLKDVQNTAIEVERSTWDYIQGMLKKYPNMTWIYNQDEYTEYERIIFAMGRYTHAHKIVSRLTPLPSPPEGFDDIEELPIQEV